MRFALSLTLILSLTGSVASLRAQENSQWSRVRKIEPGSKINITLAGSEPSERYFVSADDSRLIALNLSDPALPDASARVLRRIISQHSEYFDRVASGENLVVDGLRLNSAGVVQIADRHDVTELATRRKGRGFWGHLGPLGGYFVGAMAGGYAAGFACRAVSGPNRCDTGAFLTGGLLGGIAAGAYGFQAAARETERVIYRVP